MVSYFFFSPEIALQHVSMFFRSEPKWEVVEPLKDIGKKSMYAQKLAVFFPMSCHNLSLLTNFVLHVGHVI